MNQCVGEVTGKKLLLLQFDTDKLVMLEIEATWESQQVAYDALCAKGGKLGASEAAALEVGQQIVCQVGEKDVRQLAIEAVFAPSREVEPTLIGAKLFGVSGAAVIIHR